MTRVPHERRYKHLILPWSEQLHALAWHQQYFVALDDAADRHARQARLCTLPYDSGNTSTSVRLPPHVGLAKFSKMLFLLRRGHGRQRAKQPLYNWDVTVIDVGWCVVLWVVVLVSRLTRFT